MVAKDLAKNLEAGKDYFYERLIFLFNLLIEGLEKLVPYGLRAIGAIAILVIGIYLSRKLSAWMRTGFERARVEPTLRSAFHSLIRYTVIAVAFVAALNQFGIDTAALIAVLGAAGLAIGLALQGTLTNVAAGVMVLLLRPFKVGHYVSVADGVEGYVDAIDLFTTEFVTFNNVYISVPNSKIWGATIINYTSNSVRAVTIKHFFCIDTDVEAVRKLFVNLMKEHASVLHVPEPYVYLHACGWNHVEITSKCYVRTEDFWDVLFILQEKLVSAARENGFKRPDQLPNPHLPVLNYVTQ